MNLLDTLQRLAVEPDAPLDVGHVALLLATDEYPELDVPYHLRMLDALSRDLRPELYGDLECRVQTLTRFLFEFKGFQGNQFEYYDPRNSYFNDVLTRKLGIPITLSLLAMSVGARVGLEIVGVGLPGHFVAKANDEEQAILFDPFHQGQILTRHACQQIVHAVTGQFITLTEDMLRPMPRAAIFLRMLNNLKAIYLKAEDYRRALRVIQRMRVLSPHDVSLRRDQGVALLRVGQPGPAITHLKAYLEQSPTSVDAELVRQVLDKARSEVARWN